MNVAYLWQGRSHRNSGEDDEKGGVYAGARAQLGNDEGATVVPRKDVTVDLPRTTPQGKVDSGSRVLPMIRAARTAHDT